MKSCIITGLIIFLASIPCVAQDYGWAAKDESVFPVGWTSDGAYFAYGIFDFSPMISNQSRIRIAVQSVKTDKVAWEYGKSWDETNVGDGSAGTAPRTAAEAWKRVSAQVSDNLARYKIVIGGIAGPARFPLQAGDSLGVAIVEQPEVNYQVPFQVRFVSRNLGSKLIYSGVKSSLGNELLPLGYFPNTDSSRIVVVLYESGFSSPFPTYYLIGCHTKNGFTKE